MIKKQILFLLLLATFAFSDPTVKLVSNPMFFFTSGFNTNLEYHLGYGQTIGFDYTYLNEEESNGDFSKLNLMMLGYKIYFGDELDEMFLKLKLGQIKTDEKQSSVHFSGYQRKQTSGFNQAGIGYAWVWGSGFTISIASQYTLTDYKDLTGVGGWVDFGFVF